MATKAELTDAMSALERIDAAATNPGAAYAAGFTLAGDHSALLAILTALDDAAGTSELRGHFDVIYRSINAALQVAR